MRKYENINPTDAEKMKYVCAGLYPVKNDNLDSIANLGMLFVNYISD